MAHTTRPSDTLLEHARVENRRLEASEAIQRTCTYPWAAVAERNADYRTFGQAEALRMGADHPRFLIQSRRKPRMSAGRLHSATQLSQVEMTRPYPARPAMVPPGANEVLSERQPTQSLASESMQNTTVTQSVLGSLAGGGPRDSIAPSVLARGGEQGWFRPGWGTG